jgi:hypothetical protein
LRVNAAAPAQRVAEIDQFVFRTRDQQQIIAAFGKSPGERFADSRRRAGN